MHQPLNFCNFSANQTAIETSQLQNQFDRPAIARHGLTIRDVARILEAALQGVKASRVLEGQTSYDLFARLDEPESKSDIAATWRLDTIGGLLVDTPAGAKVPLHSLARIWKDTGPNQVVRKQVERRIVVQCNVPGRDVTGVVHDIQKLVDSRAFVLQRLVQNRSKDWGICGS